MTKATTRRASTPSNSSGIGDRIVGMRLDIERDADPSDRSRIGHDRALNLSNRHAANGDNVAVNATRRQDDGDARRHRGRPAHHRRPCAAHAAAAGAAAVGADRRRGLRQIRESAGHQFVQGARRLRQARVARRRRAPPRRHRHVGRQPCPGGGLSRPAPRHPGDHRHAGDDAVREGQGDRGARRRRRARRRDA